MWGHFFAYTLALVLLSTACPASARFQSPQFDSTQEFPVLFLPSEYRGLPRGAIPQEVAEKSLARLEAAMASIFARLEVPLVVDGKLQPVRYFSYLEGELKKIDPTVQIVPSGGVVRALISYLYYKIHSTLEQNPLRTAESVLEEITNETRAIPAYEVRGVGSDFDVLLLRYAKENREKLIERAAKITNSAEENAGMRWSDSALKRAFFTVADIKDYHEQITRSTRQGGSDIDFLAFNMITGKMITPPSQTGGPDYRQIALNLVCGYFRYMVPQENVDDPEKQTIRGIRPLLELPFLKLLDEGQLRKEISALVEKVLAGGTLSPKSYQQFSRLVRNARFHGAHNRTYRAAPHSIDELVFQLVKALPREAKNLPAIPEFVDQFPLGRPSDVPEDLLMPLDHFIQHHTDKGVLYHGTPEVEKSMAILRQGLFVSGGKMEQGTYVFDRGGYLSWDRGFSQGYAGSNGLVFDLQFNKDPRIKILDWGKAKNHPWILQLMAANPMKDIFEILARQHGIDIILHGHVLLQNMAAIKMNGNLGMVLRALHQSVQNMIDAPEASFEPYAFYKLTQEYLNLAYFYRGIGGESLPEIDIQTVVERYQSRLVSGQSTSPTEDFNNFKMLSHFKLEKAPLFNKLEELLRSPEFGHLPRKIKLEYANLLPELWSSSEERNAVLRLLSELFASVHLEGLFTTLNKEELEELEKIQKSTNYHTEFEEAAFWKLLRHKFPGLSDDDLIRKIIFKNMKEDHYRVIKLLGWDESRVLALGYEDLLQKVKVDPNGEVIIADDAVLRHSRWPGYHGNLNDFLRRKYLSASANERKILEALNRDWRNQYKWRPVYSIAQELWKKEWTPTAIEDAQHVLREKFPEPAWKQLQLNLLQFVVNRRADEHKEPYDRLDRDAIEYIKREVKAGNTEVIRILFTARDSRFLNATFENKYTLKYNQPPIEDFDKMDKQKWLKHITTRVEGTEDLSWPLFWTFADHKEPFLALRFGLSPVSFDWRRSSHLWTRYFESIVLHEDPVNSATFQATLDDISVIGGFHHFLPSVGQGKIKRDAYKEFKLYLERNPKHHARHKIEQFLSLNERDATSAPELRKMLGSSAPISSNDMELLTSTYGRYSPNAGLIVALLIAKNYEVTNLHFYLDTEETLPLFHELLKKTDISPEVMNKYVFPNLKDPLHARSVAGKQVARLAMKIVMNQTSWANYLSGIIRALELEEIGYEVRVQLVRRLAQSPPEVWAEVRKYTRYHLSPEQNPLIKWMIHLRAANFSTKDCGRLMLPSAPAGSLLQ